MDWNEQLAKLEQISFTPPAAFTLTLYALVVEIAFPFFCDGIFTDQLVHEVARKDMNRTMGGVGSEALNATSRYHQTIRIYELIIQPRIFALVGRTQSVHVLSSNLNIHARKRAIGIPYSLNFPDGVLAKCTPLRVSKVNEE